MVSLPTVISKYLFAALNTEEVRGVVFPRITLKTPFESGVTEIVSPAQITLPPEEAS
jgi:hypothetical protein